MLLAERVQNERLRQIIKELQRHRFGRRAETLPEDQMLLGLEDVEQAEANREAAQTDERRLMDAAGPGSQAPRSTGERCRRICRGLRSSSTSTTRPAPCCQGELHRIGEDRSERLDMVPAQFRVLVTRRTQICLPGLRGRCRAGAGAGAADRGRIADRGHRRPGSGVQICRPSAAVPPGPDLRPPGHRSRSLDAGRLGRPCRLAPASAA